MTQLGGIDVIVSDGGKAILAAAKALRQSLILVQHIHQGKGNRTRIIQLESIPNRNTLWETTVELHTGSLLANTEFKIIARAKKVYPANWTSPTSRKRRTITHKYSQKASFKRTGVLTPIEKVGSSKKAHQRKTIFLKGHAITLRTGINPCEYELGFIPNESDFTATDCPSLTQLQAMSGIVQQMLPKQFISSNRAETFNVLHDRYNVYWGENPFSMLIVMLEHELLSLFFPRDALSFFSVINGIFLIVYLSLFFHY